MRLVSFREYVKAIMRTAKYKPCEKLDCVVAWVKALPGCMTQGRDYEEARELLIDAVETWILSAVKDGEDLPEVNGCRLAFTLEALDKETSQSPYAESSSL